MSDSSFYIGRAFDVLADPKSAASMEAVRYDPDDLTTHGVIVGMTGSGKTGLLISMLEEAALKGLPSIVIDPKGDLTNLLLHFPEQQPSDFEPWIDPEAARREGMTVPQLAETTAARWKAGLQSWDLDSDELSALQQAVDYVVYTPGSSAGNPVSLLSSFAPPHGLNWEEHREILRERISATVTALLGLVGLQNVDPLRSREHILLSNIVESAWAKGQPLDMTELIMQTQSPPFERLGAFPVNSFFPEKDRFDLAMLLNNFLASPSFQSWTEGASMEVQDFLYTPQGRPRMSIFYLAHLDENERMFFVTLLLASVESWMRSQRGASGLRALLAFDEIVGYLPPIANPPSRPVLLRLLKQARAFGLGLLLATQNPVDLDYKGLSNTGTWFIGRLQTERDKMRLLEGLAALEGGVDVSVYDRMISALSKRVFLLHNVHNRGGAKAFQVRWCLNYLAGPLSRSQLAQLKPLGSGPEGGVAASPTTVGTSPAATVGPMATGSTAAMGAMSAGASPVSVGASPTATTGQAVATTRSATNGPAGFTRTPAAPPAGVKALFLPPQLSLSQALGKLGGAFSGPGRSEGVLYRPGVIYQAEVAYVNRKIDLDAQQRFAVLVGAPEGRVDWDAWVREALDPAALDPQPPADAVFAPLPTALSNARTYAALEKDFVDWVYRKGEVRLYANETLKVYSKPGDSQATFRQVCDAAARSAMQGELDKATRANRTKLDALERKISAQELKVKKNEDEVNQRRMEELSTGAEVVMSLFSRRKKGLSSSLTKRRLTSQAQSDLEASEKLLDGLHQDLDRLKKEAAEAEADVKERWARVSGDISEMSIAPLKKDIYLELNGLVWLPVYLVNAEGRTIEAPAF
ncbi:MAG: DUF853 family protein [Anaerolineae bacterium]|nr:DUF853 family protein [Anaerolineae bacterium]